MQTSLFQTSGLADFLAKMSPSPAWVKGMDSEELNQVSSSTLLDYWAKHFPELLSSKTCQVFFLPTEEEISEPLFKRWPASGMLSDGVLLTVDTSASPSHVTESTLLDVIEMQQDHPRYYLSQNAAVGILRRADRMERPLYPPLRKSLEILSGMGQSSKNLPTASTLPQQDIQEPTGVEPTSVPDRLGEMASRTQKGNGKGRQKGVWSIPMPPARMLTRSLST